MTNRSSLAPALAMIVLVCAPLAASADDDFGRSGPYVRGGVAAAFDLTSLLGEFVDTGVGLGVAGGYRANKWLALEGQFHWLGETNLGDGGTNVAKIERWDASANVKVSTAGRVQPYALAGIGYGNYSIKSTSSSQSGSAGSFIARFGGGLDVYITRNIAVYAEGTYVLTTGDIDPFNYAVFGAGAMFRF